MKKICIGIAILFFVLFSAASVLGQQTKIQTPTNNHPQNKHSEQSKKVDKTDNREDGKAEYELGCMYDKGEGVPQDYVKALSFYRKAAEKGYVDAQYLLGNMYYHGIDVSKNYAKAAEWFRKAAEKGNTFAQFNLAFMYYKGEGIPQDYAEAVKWSRKAAEKGFDRAQYNLGYMYHYGQGVSPDYIKASEWYRKAAEQGFDRAQDNLETLNYLNYYGKGIPKNPEEAVKWSRKAAEQGNAEAQLNLGYMYEDGQGVPKDYAKAAKWFRKAAEQENAEAQHNLGFMYEYGRGVPKDNAKATKWFQKAGFKGVDEAHHTYFDRELSPLYSEGVAEHDRWFRKAAEHGNAYNQYLLGGAYYFGKRFPKDYIKAVKWYRKAAEQGHRLAQSDLGDMYYKGEGVPQDYAEAIKWYRKAAEQGDDDARSAIGECLEKTDYQGWEYLTRTDTEYIFINKNKIRRQGNLVWYWIMKVPFQKSNSNKKRYYVADCNSASSGLVSYIEYDSNDEVINSHTLKKSEIDMSPVVPGSIGESELEYACSHAKAGTYKKEETAKTGACFGTGWPVASGFVITNYHVVEGRNHITLIRPDGVKIPASVAAHDTFNDLALLKVEDTGLLPAALPLSSKPAVLGEKVITIGYPQPDLLGVKPKLTEGVINSTSGLGDDPRALQISVPIQAGNSGGPLVNMEGKVVGIITSKIDAVKMFKWTGDLPQNINYGIKISYLKGLLSSVPQKQRIDTLAPFKYTSVQELAKEIRNSVLMIMAN